MKAPVTLRLPVPGEFWRIDAWEGHVLFMGLNDVKDLLDADEEYINNWLNILHTLDRDYTLALARGSVNVPDPLIIPPTDEDFEFFEKATKMILEIGLLPHFVGQCGEDCDCDCGDKELLACGQHTPDVHRKLLNDWIERELELPKKFTSSRAAIKKLTQEEQILGLPIVSAEDAERMIQEELAKMKSEGFSPEDQELVRQIKKINDWSQEQAEEYFWNMRERTVREGVEETMRVIE